MILLAALVLLDKFDESQDKMEEIIKQTANKIESVVNSINEEKKIKIIFFTKSKIRSKSLNKKVACINNYYKSFSIMKNIVKNIKFNDENVVGLYWPINKRLILDL